MAIQPPGKNAAAGAALGTAIYPGVGTVIGGAGGWLVDQFGGGDSSPQASGGTPYNVNPAAYGGLPVNFGAPDSSQTGSYADAYNATLNQMNSEIAALEQQKQDNHATLINAGQGPDGLASADRFYDDLIAKKQQDYAPQLQQLGAQYQASQHQDQLQGLQQMGNAAQSRQAPQINQGAYLNGSGGGSYGGQPGAPMGGGGSYGGGPAPGGVSPNGTINLNPGPRAGAVVPQVGAQAGGAGTGAFNPAGQSAGGLYDQLAANGANPAVRNRAADIAGQSRTLDTGGLSGGQIAQQVINNTVAANAAAAPPPDNPLYIDYQNQLAARQGQSQLISQLQDAAAGRGPSAAQAQLQAGLDANIAQAQSMAHSARGGSGAQALAARSALMSGAQATQQTANQAAQLRAQEMQNAYGQLGAALQSQRGGDISSRNTSAGIATNNAQLQLQQQGQNDAATQYYYSLYMSALAGDRDAQIQLQQIQSNNYNTAQGHGIDASQVNSQNYWNQQGRNDKYFGAGLQAIGTFGQAQGAQGAGQGQPAQGGSSSYGSGWTTQPSGFSGTSGWG